MLDEKDLQAIAGLIDSRAEKSEKLLLDEMGRFQTYFEKRFYRFLFRMSNLWRAADWEQAAGNFILGEVLK